MMMMMVVVVVVIREVKSGDDKALVMETTADLA